MIYDSVIWKIELKERIANFKTLIANTNFSADDWYAYETDEGWSDGYKFFIEFQKFCFYSAIISRKCIESHRLSDECKSTEYPVTYFSKRTAETLTKNNLKSVEEEYNVENKLQEKMLLNEICHLFIHSLIFNPKLIENKSDLTLPDDEIDNWEVNGLAGLYINTDHSKDKRVYYFDLAQLFEIFENVSTDQIVYIYENRVLKTIKRSRHYPPGHKEPKI